MKLLLAAYDPSHKSPVGNYWPWSHPSISQKMLDNMYHDVIRERLPENANKITQDDLIGGCCSLSDDRCFWYRIFNGGHDRAGRPGRYVAIIALLNAREINGCGWNEFLTSPLMQAFAEDALVIPLPTPSSFEIDWNEPAMIASEELRNHVNGKKEVGLKEKEVGPALGLIAETSNLKSFHLTLDWDDKKVLTLLRSDSPIQLLIHDLEKENNAVSLPVVITTNASNTETIETIETIETNGKKRWKVDWKDWTILFLLLLMMALIMILQDRLTPKTDNSTPIQPTAPIVPERPEPAVKDEPPKTPRSPFEFLFRSPHQKTETP
jgi:hypothetical protein